ncbi:MAG: hypothetical protein ABGX16_02535 [Pirellulales bacterium]
MVAFSTIWLEAIVADLLVDQGQSKVRRHQFDSQQQTQTFQASYLLDGAMPTTVRINCRP